MCTRTHTHTHTHTHRNKYGGEGKEEGRKGGRDIITKQFCKKSNQILFLIFCQKKKTKNYNSASASKKPGFRVVKRV